MTEKPKSEHMGFKFIHLIISMALAAIWTLFNFFSWVTGITAVTLQAYSYGLVGIVIYLFFAFIWQILRAFFIKAGKVINPEYNDPDLGFTMLALTLVLVLGAIWGLFNFFSWVGLVVIGAADLVTFAYGLIGLTIFMLFVFVCYVMWAFFHRVSTKMEG